ncbi:MAG: 2-amino-4-hydroxy-6-hydroxymethyldihydropteridine diphosphokinase [Bryobacteraceae bacterium]
MSNTLSRPPKSIYLSLGSNLGDREEHLNRALAAIEAASIRITARSSVYETEPQGFREQPWFLNLAVACETAFFPFQLLVALQHIEREVGRVRRPGAPPNDPRLIDIDILMYSDIVMNSPALVIPHPRMLERRFVLEPLVEIAPHLRHPGTGRPIVEFLHRVGSQKVRRFKP